MKIQDLKYLLAYLMPLSSLLAMEWLGYWSFSTVILAFVLLPVLEMIIPPDTQNLYPEREQQRKANRLFDALLYLNIPIVYFLLFRTLFVVQGDLHWAERTGLLLNLGIVLATAGINVAHEIGHRSGILNRISAALLLAPSLYGHFTIEHNIGHHKWVGTPDDPVTAKYGQSIYHYWGTAVYGVFVKAWQLSFRQMERQGRPRFHYSNELIWITLLQIALMASYFLAGGLMILVFGIAAAVISFTLLECIDYVEHYGLQRKKLPSGKYERVSERHSWNSDHELGRIFLYELTRHTDHHLHALRKYQTLRHIENSPQLPYGYPASILMALFPPVWFRVMNPKVKAYNF
ncbi:alkane 1-monooxygenase [Portibacter marinus]|uniref:alkane 1-monooxygenase n=1 Tax=Portibacter marinus TaxID=2898660 RepID=UPI001F3EAE9F|nr:alkane 1-monooxygenase [Portibacter marinus]